MDIKDEILRRSKGGSGTTGGGEEHVSSMEVDYPVVTETPTNENTVVQPGRHDKPSAETEPVLEEGAPARFRSYTDIVHMLRPGDLSPEQKEKERKRERTRALIAAIGDGVSSSLANLYYVSKGAANTTPQGPLLSETNRKRYEELLAKREKQQQEYIAALERAGFADLANEHKAQLQREHQVHQARQAEKTRLFQEEQKKQEREYAKSQAEAERNYRSEEAEKQRKFQGGQNAANRAVQARRYEAQEAKDRATRIYNFQRSQGDEIPFTLNGRTFVIGSKALTANVGNIVANILEDLRNSPKFRDKTEKQLLKDTEWLSINRALNTSRTDVKKLAETMKLYAKDSPSAIAAIERLDKYYRRGKQEAETGTGYMPDEGFGFIPDPVELDVDMLFD